MSGMSIKSEVRRRDDTMTMKQESTARRIESMQQSSATPSLHLLGPGCERLLYALTLPHSAFLFQQFLAHCLLYILHNKMPTNQKHIRESVDSLHRNCAALTCLISSPYIYKTYNCLNAASVTFLSLTVSVSRQSGSGPYTVIIHLRESICMS